ncbi:MAG TPA: hypothetical protein VFY99_08235 [Solirubrobacterales bacterium]
MATSPNLDHAISGLILIRDAQRAVDAALRLPIDDRAAVDEQIQAVRDGAGEVASSLAATVPGAQSLLGAGQSIGGGLVTRPELRALGGLVGFFASQGSQALGAVAGAADSLGGERDRTLDLSERITNRLAEVGVTTRTDLARELDVDPRSAEFRDALERTLGTGHAEWYGSATYGLPRPQLEALLARARLDSEGETGGGRDAAAESDPPDPEPAEPAAPRGLGAAAGELRAAVDGLRAAVARRTGAP